MFRRPLQLPVPAPCRGLVTQLSHRRRAEEIAQALLGGKEIACQCSDQPVAAVSPFDLPPTRLTVFGNQPGDFIEALIGLTGFVCAEHPGKPQARLSAAIVELAKPRSHGTEPLDRDQGSAVSFHAVIGRRLGARRSATGTAPIRDGAVPDGRTSATNLKIVRS